MPVIRIVMPNGTTRPFREGTPKAVIERAKRDMLASMNETDEDHRAYRAHRAVMVTQETPPDAEMMEIDIPADEFAPMTADQISQILPGTSRKTIESQLDGINAAMTGMNRAQRAAFMGQVAVENPRLLGEESFKGYTEEGARKNFSNVRSDPDLGTYMYSPYELAKRAYDGRNGNIPGSDDGYTYRGRGLLQLTGRENYRNAGFENDPDGGANALASVEFWRGKKLDEASANVLDRSGFDKITRTVNGNAMLKANDRWDGYQRALKAFGLAP